MAEGCKNLCVHCEYYHSDYGFYRQFSDLTGFYLKTHPVDRAQMSSVDWISQKEEPVESKSFLCFPMNNVQADPHTVYQKSGGASMAKTEFVCENVFQSCSEEERRHVLTEIFVELIEYFESSRIAS